MSSLRDMPLHSVYKKTTDDGKLFILRVPGGWVYTTLMVPNGLASVFVPEPAVKKTKKSVKTEN